MLETSYITWHIASFLIYVATYKLMNNPKYENDFWELGFGMSSIATLCGLALGITLYTSLYYAFLLWTPIHESIFFVEVCLIIGINFLLYSKLV